MTRDDFDDYGWLGKTMDDWGLLEWPVITTNESDDKGWLRWLGMSRDDWDA